jgi:glycosyltransferase involved in cell wall biosynthesis
MDVMKLLVINNGLWLSGAQITANEFLQSIKNRIKIKILSCTGAKYTLNLPGVEVYKLPCRKVGNLPVMNLNNVAQKFVEWADIVWIATSEFALAPKIKALKKVPVVAHLHSYEFLCPLMWLSYGFKEVCDDNCSLSKIVSCKLRAYLEMASLDIIPSIHKVIDPSIHLVKDPLEYVRWRQLIGGVLDSIDGYIAVSNALWSIHIDHVPELAEKPSAVIYNPVTEPLKYIRPDPEEPYSDYILYASGPNLHKGPHLLLKAWSEVHKELRGMKLYMVGCKNSWIEKLASKMGLSDIVFMERLPLTTNYYYLMYKAKAVVMPSIAPESFGRIPVEANRLGVPAIVSSSGGLPEVIEDGVTGYIFKSSDFSELSERIIRLLINRDFDRITVMENSNSRLNAQRQIEELTKFFEKVLRNA